jgi:hypothetical protein
MFHTWHPFVKGVGFSRQPTTHYDFAFWRSLYNLKLAGSVEKPRETIKYDQQCLNDKAMFSVHLDYLKRLVLLQFNKLVITNITNHRYLRHYTTKRTFTYFWTSDYSHDAMEHPVVLNANLTQFLKDVQPFLNNTITLVVTDHGIRWGEMRIETVFCTKIAKL